MDADVRWSAPATSTVGSGRHTNAPATVARTVIVDGVPEGPGSTIDAAALRSSTAASVSTMQSSSRSSPPMGPAPLETRNSPSGVDRNESGGAERRDVNLVRSPMAVAVNPADAFTRARGRGDARASP